MKRYVFTIQMSGEGYDVQEGFDNAVESFLMGEGVPEPTEVIDLHKGNVTQQVTYLRSLIKQGWEFPDAVDEVAHTNNLTDEEIEELKDEYDRPEREILK